MPVSMNTPPPSACEPGSQPPAVPRSGDWFSRSHLQALVLLLLTALGIALCYRMAAPFLPAIAWALALAVLFMPLQHRLESKLRHASLAALMSVMVISLLVVVPVIFVGQQLVVQAAKGAQLIDDKVTSGEWRRAIEAQPRLAPVVDRIEQQIDLPGAVKSLTAKLTGFAGLVVKGSVFHLIGFGLTLYLLFFFLRDRSLVLAALRALSPLTAPEMDRLFARVGDTLHATIYGTLAVAALQGFLGGLMFWWLGLPAPMLWGVVMALLAVVPVLGAFVVWIPAALFLLLQGSWDKALILAVWGAGVVGTSDNLLRPVLVGKRLKLHTILAFLSVVGGLIVFGPAGLILGPVTLTVTTELLEIWPRRAAAEAGDG